MQNIEKFLKHVMKNDYKKYENDQLMKYYNNQFEVIFQKKKEGKKIDLSIVIDKRGKPIIYNNIVIALNNLQIPNTKYKKLLV